MAGRLIQHLIDKSKEHPHLQLLHAQWSFDEELIPKALQNIASIFPHYSRHDASHSRQILINIERILGDQLTKLTATDTWLLIEAAFWHDIGMVVSFSEIDDDLNSPEFKQYIREISENNSSELHEFAKRFITLDPNDCFGAAATPQEAVELYRQILASWYRARHPERTEVIVKDPWTQAGISSPRNELVPHRLFHLLGRICRIHGNDFKVLLRELPFCENGMASELCHPRFVAALLRLGDLFDLDNNRFCPVMLRAAGSIPPSSQAHIDKHAAISHFRLDPTCVEIKAECKDPASYEVTDTWFSWIEQEFHNQMAQWAEIVPSRDFGLLPTLAGLEATLVHPHEVLEPGRRPRFGVDVEKAIELLRGAGIYSDRFQSVRELLQNAVDSTLIRIWLAHGKGESEDQIDIDWSSPISDGIKELFSGYPITVRLTKVESSKSGKNRWQLDIKDKGVGVSREDLIFMKSVGASYRNKAKRLIVERMPLWMRPSGAFGIGLQSVFMITDEVVLTSKSMISGQAFKVKMTSPESPTRGLIFLERTKAHPGDDFGVKMSLAFEVESIPKSISFDRDYETTREILSRFDPIRMVDLPYESARLIDEIRKFSQLCPVPIKLHFDEMASQSSSPQLDTTENGYFYSSNNGTLLSCVEFDSENSGHIVAYRGQTVKDARFSFPFCSFVADLVTGNASDILTINRNGVKKDAEYQVFDRILASLVEFLQVDGRWDKFNPEEVAAASAFLKYFDNNVPVASKIDAWKHLKFPYVEKTLAELLEMNEFSLLVEESWFFDRNKEIIPGEREIVIRNFSHTMGSPLYKLFLYEWIYAKGGFVVEDVSDVEGVEARFTFTTSDVPPFTDAAFKRKLVNLAKQGMFGGRFYLRVWGKYSPLAANIDGLPLLRSMSVESNRGEVLILPFFFDREKTKVTTDGLDELCAWVHQNALDRTLTKDYIRDLYGEFIHWIDTVIMKDDPSWAGIRSSIQ